MFNKILIANRGEIALRIIRACKELGIQSVLVYSQADRDSLPVQMADEAYCIGPAAPGASYLLIDRILSVAAISDVEAVHPGYGFLAENAYFAEACRKHKITFIGPTPEAMRALGDKAVARDTMKKAGVPTTPGSEGLILSESDALKTAHTLKYPVIIKASAGGGGRGMRIAHNDASLIQGYHAAKTEAENAFGDGAMYMEKFLINPRHIEFQILADNYGNVVHLGERDCSIQRRQQKLIEESPSPALNPRLREKMGTAAVKAAKAANYTNAGTIEFLLTDSGEFYFMEMNTRVQVEHPVTEELTGIDIIKEQIRIAAGERLPFRQRDIKFTGHVIECRINAENPDRNFTPSPGLVEKFIPAGGIGVRLDSHVFAGYRIPPYYDSMIAKLIIRGADRTQALARCQRALSEFVVEGVKTTIPFTQKILANKDFKAGKFDTGFIERMMQDIGKVEINQEEKA
ncbi:acetyl-CoA carboxylase biotin carboxylase subunit [Victivallis sp. Marseille-Q1083]|uniref:acetyl-CoA carboxylase biotin carboxylase subunit n=1 Tax=Victivallis sp. Marseille-Q1083 TaxID=2717288 RepID=UPI00158C5EF0|nr:acetyl-CoA carboxylase biotin carboxylase subunit [Victivallis sp. Marseille-Q1083]